ncbi:hypothetical protein K1719_008787 [Acacia pycnantha]|nr:hypothetical protein K1719_008787 [Acacia pycnantha]
MSAANGKSKGTKPVPLPVRLQTERQRENGASHFNVIEALNAKIFCVLFCCFATWRRKTWEVCQENLMWKIGGELLLL